MTAVVARRATGRWLLPALIGAGVALRLAVIAPGRLAFHEAEAGAVALAFAQGRGLADAFFPGSGPTAHLLPTTPVVAGAILRLAGPQSTASALLLVAFALGQLVVSTLLSVRLFTLLGASRAAVLAAVGWSMLVPVVALLDTLSFRVWDNGLAFIAVLACLIDQVRVARGEGAGAARLLRSAALLAVAAFVNPAMGAALAVGAFAVRWRAQGLGRGVALGGATLILFAAVSAPWAERNGRVLGAPILSRSNAGLELALANGDGALHAADPAAAFAARHRAIHPFDDGPGRATFRRLGEPAYQQALGQAAARWIAAHPLGFARLAARHMLRMLTPQRWQIATDASAVQAAAVGVVCWAGLVALAWLVVRDRGAPWWIVALFVAAALVAYAPFQPTIRYTYPFYQLLLFSAAAGAERAWRGLNSPAGRATYPFHL